MPKKYIASITVWTQDHIPVPDIEDQYEIKVDSSSEAQRYCHNKNRFSPEWLRYTVSDIRLNREDG